MSSSVCTSSRQSPPFSDHNKIIPHHQFGLNNANQHHHSRNPRQSIGTMVEQLDRVYELVRKLLTDFQSVTTGLFPRYSIDRNIGYVKDSIYCALACWACSMAYKRVDDGRGRETELCQTAVKTMRGILFLWMRQVDKLNSFKQNNAPQFSLHSRFDLHTGNELASITFPHLQMDTIALYILALVEMTVAGAQIIYTAHEVAFLQNLVFYIERTYRTPDFGIWERGTRYNQGVPELHASSLGMVKAALESVNGFNVYGQKGTSESVIYVDIDGHNRNRTTFETLLPRESNSKNTDAALLLTTGWPAFATHDQHLLDATMAKCQRYLEGSYGMRRFLRDGYRTELEDQTKRFYDDEETAQFSKIESQFPMFLAVIAITAHFKGQNELSDKYWMKFQDLLVEFDSSGHAHSNHLLCPECYCVDEEHMEEERKMPNSQKYYPLSHREFGHHLWSNAIYILGTLLREKLIHLSDIDPIYRHLPASERPKYMPINRSAAFHGGKEGNPVVQIALISESSQLQMLLSTYGITTQTPHEIEPIQIWPSWRMVKLMEHLGKDEKLGINGRPPRPLGALNTSKIFRVCGDTVLIYPLIFELSDFYTYADPATLIDDIKRELEFVAKRWKLAGRPTFCIILREENVAGEYFENMLDLLVDLKNGLVNGVRVRLGRIHQLINTGCLEQFDMVDPDSVDFDVEILSETEGKETKSMGRTNLRMPSLNEEEMAKERDFDGKDDQILYQIIAKNDPESLRVVAISIAIMQKRYSANFMVQGENLSSRMERIYRQACQLKNSWWLVRYCAAKLGKKIINLAPSVTNLLVRGKQIIIGHKSCREILISAPSTPVELQNAIFSSCDPNEPHATVFQQELIVACSDLISRNADAFDGILTIRLAWYTTAISMLLGFIKEDLQRRKRREAEGKEMPSSKNSPGGQFFDLVSYLESSCPIFVVKQFKMGKEFGIYDFPPTVVKKLVDALMTRKEIWHLLSPLQIKKLNGALNRVPINLYDRVWKILERVQQGIIISGHILPQYPTLQVMTRHELNFSYKVESMMSDITHPEYRQLIVELLCIVATLMERNPEIYFTGTLDCDQLVKQAFNLFCEEHRIKDRVDMGPFYAIDDDPAGAPTSSYLIRVVVDKLLKDTNIRHRICAPSLGFGEKSMGGARKEEECSII